MMRKNNRGVAQRTVVIIIAVVVIIGLAVFGYFQTKNKALKEVQDTDSYKIYNYKYSINTNFAIRVPGVFADNTKNYLAGPGIEKMAFLGCDYAAVAVGRSSIGGVSEENADDVEKLVNDVLANMQFEGQKVEPKKKGDFTIFSFSSDNVKVLKDKDKKAFVMIGYMFDGSHLYEVTAWCYDEYKEDFEEYMEKWITSFYLFK